MTTSTTRPLALVTGASSGIGLELAKQFAENGFDVVMAAEDAELEPAAGQVRALGAAVSPVRVDLRKPEDVELLWQAVHDSGHTLEAAALNAGVGVGGAFVETDLQAELDLVQLNCAATLHLATDPSLDHSVAEKARLRPR